MDKNNWAILVFDSGSYCLKENDLDRETAEKLAAGKYPGQDIILTISSGDLFKRISILNSAVSA